MLEGFEDALSWAGDDTRAARRREYEQYLRSVSPKREDARPELDLSDPYACGLAAWRYVNAAIRTAIALVTEGEAEPVEMDNELLIEQMRQSMAVGW